MSEQEQIIGRLAQIEEIIAQYDDVIKVESDLARQECAIVSAERLREEFNRLSDDERLLNIGIIGRVKAGKSSLLNSVFFKGESILPKAATPMTASLTVMTHGDVFSATVEYYSANDLAEIKRQHDEYKKLWELKFNEHKKAIEARARKNDETLSAQEIETKAKRMADREINNDSLSSSFEQYKLMQKSGKLDEMSRGGAEETIQAATVAELMGRLNKYVASDGELMPFTRNAIIRLPMDSLRDIQVVDTPGINDPVTSRTQRTSEYLGKCDVVFIVSPAGQFVSSEDTNLMDRLSSKEGVRELYLVGSQVDNQLYGSPGEEAKWDLDKALDAIRSGLSGHAVQTLSEIKQSNPEVGDLFDQIVKDGKDRVILTSAISHAMSLRFKERAGWDNDMNHAWNLLKEHYPDYFGSDVSAKERLEKLSGVNTVSEKISLARSKKDAIIAKKLKDYLEGQKKNIDDFSKELKTAIANKIDVLNNTDIKTVREQIQNLKKLSSKVTNAIDGTFDDCVDDFKLDLRNSITEKTKALFQETREKVNGEEKSETRTGNRIKGTGFLAFITGGKFGNEDYIYEVTTIRSGAVKNTLSNLITDLQDNLINSVETAKKDWKKSVQQRITHALIETVEDVDLIDFEMLKTAIRRLVNNMELPELDLSSRAFSGSQTGTLEGDSAEQFISEVQAHLEKLRIFYREQTHEFISALEKTSKREKMSGLVLGDIGKQLENLENELNNKNVTLDRLKKCKKTLEGIT
jgi:predicted GTPase